MIAACGEVGLQYKREPGLFQWYLVPYCENEFNFASTRANIESEVAKAADSACAELLKYCDATDETYYYDDEEKRNRIFMCGKGITASSDCKTIDDLLEVIYDTSVKPILTNTLCANQPPSEFMEECTLISCADYCVNYDKPDIQAKTWAEDVAKAAQYAQNVSYALSIVTPLLQCNYIIDNVASAFQSLTQSDENGAQCANLQASSLMLACGFFVGALMYIMGIYVMHRGSWIWPEEPKKLD
ncbi:hypothetical protein AGDE_03765 [Angomonas deanei]|nr:hypothetical protein AGDE_03765 [Angomonas deanei]|eukprot:EPY40163.1 hypothetical protein AGDE_03765 [Angomonas deanei]